MMTRGTPIVGNLHLRGCKSGKNTPKCLPLLGFPDVGSQFILPPKVFACAADDAWVSASTGEAIAEEGHTCVSCFWCSVSWRWFVNIKSIQQKEFYGILMKFMMVHSSVLRGHIAVHETDVFFSAYWHASIRCCSTIRNYRSVRVAKTGRGSFYLSQEYIFTSPAGKNWVTTGSPPIDLPCSQQFFNRPEMQRKGLAWAERHGCDAHGTPTRALPYQR